MLTLDQLYPPGQRDLLPVKLYPGLVAAATTRAEGRTYARAIALWLLARSIDLEGRGRVDHALLREWAEEIWTLGKFYRALREAIALGLVRIARRDPNNEKVIVMVSLLRAARLLNIRNLGAAPIVARLGALRTAATVKRALFGAFHTKRARVSTRPISREILRSLTGISRLTQLHYEKQLGGAIHKQANYLLLGLAAEHLHAAREFEHGACFKIGGQVARRLPNAYRGSLLHASASRLKKINRSLKAARLLADTDDGPGRFRRLFFDGTLTAESSARKDVDAPGIPTGLQPALILTRFFKAGETAGGSALWRAVR